MNNHNLCFEQKYEKYQSFLSEKFQFLEVKSSIYFYRRLFVMNKTAHYDLLCMDLLYETACKIKSMNVVLGN